MAALPPACECLVEIARRLDSQPNVSCFTMVQNRLTNVHPDACDCMVGKGGVRMPVRAVTRVCLID